MQELFTKMCAAMEDFRQDAWKRVNKGNALAGRRSRQKSLELEKMFKEWRKVSVFDPEEKKQEAKF